MSEKNEPSVGGDMVSVMRSDDPFRVRQVVALLEDSGIVCATPGLEHRSAVGIVGAYIVINVLVAEADAERARGILEALESGEPVDEDPPEEEEEATEPPDDPKATYRRAARNPAEADDAPPAGDIRLRRVATFAAFVFPGGAHLYTRQYLRAIVVFMMYGIALFGGAGDTPFRVLALLAVVATDVVGASYWADVSQGRNQKSLRRHTVPFGFVAVPALLWLLAHPLAALFAGPRGRSYCEVIAECGGDRDACMREVAVARGSDIEIETSCVECVEAAECEISACAAACD